MSLDPFRLTVPATPGAIARLGAHLTAWLAETHGPTAVLVRWAVVASPDHSPESGLAAGSAWVVEGVAGTVAGGLRNVGPPGP
ncbi:MAG: hypothetical protein H7338_19865 [Candidatus Sericytochromatia bacterium]|nr:hypothetical protein [Candidatus Sericytochromatia bacterium]